MDVLTRILLVGGGGFLGANLRYWLGLALPAKLSSTIPWQTLFINVSGSLLIGLLLGLSAKHNWHPHWRLLLAVGVLGGYTTFSTFAYEAVNLFQTKQYGWALLYIEASAILSVLAAWLGILMARPLPSPV